MSERAIQRKNRTRFDMQLQHADEIVGVKRIKFSISEASKNKRTEIKNNNVMIRW